MHPVCLVRVKLCSIFQPAASKLNSAFVLRVNNVGVQRQLGRSGARYRRICIKKKKETWTKTEAKTKCDSPSLLIRDVKTNNCIWMQSPE